MTTRFHVGDLPKSVAPLDLAMIPSLARGAIIIRRVYSRPLIITEFSSLKVGTLFVKVMFSPKIMSLFYRASAVCDFVLLVCYLIVPQLLQKCHDLWFFRNVLISV